MIYEREKVRLALAAEMVKNPGDTEAAAEVTAAKLGIDVETVTQAVSESFEDK